MLPDDWTTTANVIREEGTWCVYRKRGKWIRGLDGGMRKFRIVFIERV